jgi:hypothetical protein
LQKRAGAGGVTQGKDPEFKPHKKREGYKTPHVRGCEEKGPFAHCWECQLIQPLWKIWWKSLKKLELLYDHRILLLKKLEGLLCSSELECLSRTWVYFPTPQKVNHPKQNKNLMNEQSLEAINMLLYVYRKVYDSLTHKTLQDNYKSV